MSSSLIKLIRDGRLVELQKRLKDLSDGKRELSFDIQEVDEHQNTILHLIAERGLHDLVEIAVKAGANIDALNHVGQTSFIVAARRGFPFTNHVQVLAKLLQISANHEIVDDEGYHAMHWAVMEGKIDAVRHLAEKCKLLVNKQSPKSGQYPLHLASAIGNVDIAKYLIETSADIDCKTNQGNTPMHVAIVKGHYPIAEYLFKNGADLTVRNYKGETPRSLIDSKPKDDPKWGKLVSSLLVLICDARLKELRTKLEDFSEEKKEQDYDINEKDDEGNTILHLIADKGYDDIIELALKAGCQKDEQNNLGQTAFMHAAMKGHVQVLAELFRISANHEIVDDEGYHALHYAVMKKMQASVCFLVYRCANLVNVSNPNNGKYPLHLASEKGLVDVVEFLLEYGIKTDSKVNEEGTSVSSAGVIDSSPTTDNLIGKNDATVSMTDVEANDGNTPMHLAIAEGHYHVAEILFKNGANMDVENLEGKTPRSLIKLKSQEDKKWERLLGDQKEYLKQSRIGRTALSGWAFLAFFLPNSIRHRMLNSLSNDKFFKYPSFTEIYDRFIEIHKESSSGKETEDMKMESGSDETQSVMLVEEAFKYYDGLQVSIFNRDLIIYAAFTVMYIVFLMWLIPVSLVNEQKAITQSYLEGASFKYSDITEQGDIYKFLNVTLTECAFANNATFGDMTLFGPPLLRQIRVQPSQCRLNGTFDNCYGFYNGDNKDTSAFGPTENLGKYTFSGGYPNLIGSLITDRDFYLDSSRFYGNSAHAITLAPDISINYKKIEELMNDNWIDRPTRVVALNFGYINVDTGLMTAVEYISEITPSGLIFNSQRINSYPLFLIAESPVNNQFSYFIVLFLVGVLYFCYCIVDAWREKTKGWFIFELSSLLVFLAIMICVSFYIKESLDVKRIIEDHPSNIPTNYEDMQSIANIYNVIQGLAGLASIPMFMKLFTFFRLVNALSFFGRTLSGAFLELVAFVTIFGVVFISYSFQGYFWFGSQLPNFKSIHTAFMSCVRLLSGDSFYDEMRDSNPVAAPFFFLTFIILIILILINLFIAILSEHYTNVKEKMKKEYKPYDFFQQIENWKPYVRVAKGCSSKTITSGDKIVLIPADQGPVEEEMARKLEGQEIKLLVLRYHMVDHRCLLSLIKGRKVLHFSGDDDQYLSLVERPFNEISHLFKKDVFYRSVFEELNQKDMLLVYESVGDVTIEEYLYIESDLKLWRGYIYGYLSSAKLSRLTLRPKSIFSDSKIRSVLERIKKDHEFQLSLIQSKAKEKSEVEKAYADLSEEKHLCEDCREHIKKKFTEEKKPIMLLKDDIIQELQIFTASNSRNNTGKYRYEEIEREVENILRILPPSCVRKVSRTELIENYVPKPIKVFDISSEALQLIGEHESSIAEYLHDMWSYDKVTNGWRYGKVRDNGNNVHDLLKAFKNLLDKHRIINRDFARKVIGLTVQWGYTINPSTENPKNWGYVDMSKYKAQLHDGYEPIIPDIPDDEPEIKKLLPLAKILTESIHDEWCKTKLREGKKYGPKDTDKEQKDLVPYSLLSEKTKGSYEKSILNVYKAFFWIGFKVENNST